MSMIQFTRNYTDHSNNQGFQFEFHCDKCGNGFMTHFQTSAVGVATGFLRAAADIFGGVLGNVASAGDHVKDTLRGKARDEAFEKAVVEGKTHFKQCTRCGKWVCPEVCWNEQRSLCEECAPDLQEEAASIQAHVAVDQIREKAQKVDQTGGMSVAKPQMAACPHCNARVGGGKFCPECGKPLAVKARCGKCDADFPATAKFCPECGSPRGA